MSAGYERVEVTSRQQWRAWLAAHHATGPGVWLITWKKGGGPYVGYGEIVDEAICFGWVDSQPRMLDATAASGCSPRAGPGSNWSRVNKQRVRRLTEAGLMAPAGLATVEAARRDGSWTTLDAVEDLTEPDDLAPRADRRRDARRHWDTFPPLHPPRHPRMDRRGEDDSHLGRSHRPDGDADRRRSPRRPMAATHPLNPALRRRGEPRTRLDGAGSPGRPARCSPSIRDSRLGNQNCRPNTVTKAGTRTVRTRRVFGSTPKPTTMRSSVVMTPPLTASAVTTPVRCSAGWPPPGHG